MTWGLFNSEGCVENDFPSKDAAEDAARERYSPDDDLIALECCEQHPEQANEFCTECFDDELDAEGVISPGPRIVSTEEKTS